METKRRFRCCCERYKTCEECRDSEGAIRADERKKVLTKFQYMSNLNISKTNGVV